MNTYKSSESLFEFIIGIIACAGSEKSQPDAETQNLSQLQYKEIDGADSADLSESQLQSLRYIWPYLPFAGLHAGGDDVKPEYLVSFIGPKKIDSIKKTEESRRTFLI